MTAAAIAFVAAAAVAPGLFWLWLFRSRDRLRPEPWRLVARTFAAGALIAVPTAMLGALFPEGPWRSFLVTPVVEEAAKLLAVWLVVWRHPAFDEPIDGLVYAAAGALGFATLEALGYSLAAALVPGAFADPGLSPATAGFAMAALRGLVTGPGHAVWACAWGLSLARLRLHGGTRPALGLAAGFALAVGAHALFNLLSVAPGLPARAAMAATVAVGLALVLLAFRRLTRSGTSAAR